MEPAQTKKRPRILALDLLRGLFLLVILADHLAWTPSLLFQFVTAYTGMVASAAEGFFMISGLLVGYIYGPKILIHTKKTFKKLWRRGILLYILAVLFTLMYTLWGYSIPEGYIRSSTEIATNFNDALIGAITLSYSFGWADFLNRYAVFMIIAPIALWLIAKQKAYIIIVVSLLVWFFLGNLPIWSTFTAWQIVFFSGIIVGYYLPTIEAVATATRERVKSLTIFTGISILSFVVTAFFVATPPLLLLSFNPVINTDITNFITQVNSFRELILLHFDKISLSFLRLIAGTIWFTGLYILFRRYESTINKKSFGILLLLGTYSLFVYSLQALLIFAIDTTVAPPLVPNPSLILLNTFIGMGSMGIIYFATLLYAKRTIIYTRVVHPREK